MRTAVPSPQPEELTAFTKNPKKVIKAAVLRLEPRPDHKFSQNDSKVTVGPYLLNRVTSEELSSLPTDELNYTHRLKVSVS